MKNYLLGFLLTFLPLLSFGQILEERFDDITTLSGSGWIQTNQSTPLGTSNWFQGNPTVFPAHSGATNSYIGANFNNTTGGTGTISNWLITPAMNLKDGDKLTFWTRTSSFPEYDDRLEVRSSVGPMTVPSGGASGVGSFTTVNLIINDDYSLSYPNAWTEFEVVVEGVGSTPVEMRFAFRYNVILAGPIGTYSDYIGIDDVVVEEGEVVAGNPCDDKTIMQCGENYTFDLVPGSGEWVNYTDVTWNYTGSEKVWEFTAPTTGAYTFEMDEGQADADFFLMDACSNTAVNLSDGYWTGTENETVTLTEGVTYYLIADLFSASPTTVSVTVVCPSTEPTEEYCQPVLDCEDGDLITNVTFEEINNPTTCSPDGYGDYTDQVANVEAGQIYPISVTVGSGWSSESVSVWIDYNNNFIFEENEFTYIGTGSGSVVSGNIEIPADAASGEYRMRVRVAAVGAVSATWDMACDEDQGYGETEDYTISVGESTEPGEECEWTVRVWEDYFGDEVSWELRNADGDVILSGGGYEEPTYDDTQTITAAGPLEFYIQSMGTWGDNEPNYTVSNGTEILVSGQIVIGGPSEATYSDLNCDEGGEEPGGGECDITYEGSLEDGLGNMSLLALASDFNIAAEESMSVERVTFNVYSNVASVNVSFHADNAGTPGAQIVAPMSIVPTSQTFISTSTSGSNIYEVVLDLPTAQNFEGGASGTNYWLAMSTVMGSEGLGNYWEFSDTVNNGTNFFYSVDGGAVWTDAGTAGFVDDGAFILEGICGGEEPPTGEDCGQGDDSNGFENGYQIGSGTDFENADDFFVSAGNTLNVQTIELNAISMAGPMESIGFTFYEDNAGAPGTTVVETVTGLVPYEQFVIGSAFGFDVYAIYVDVDLDFAGGEEGTTYWMQPTAVAPGGEIGGYFWEITTAGSLGSPIHTRELGGAWTANVGENAVFKLHCDDVVPPPPPCVFEITFDVEPITRVDVADIDNVSDATVNGSPALEDFTAVVGNMAAGESYEIALEGNTAGDYTTFFTVFIDWNQDGDWTDAGEMYEIGSITNSTGTDGQQAIGTITVPADAMEGATVMRVIKNFNTSPINPCGSYAFGQGEDYTINVGDVPPGGEDCNQEVPSNALENGLFLGGADNQRLAVDITVAANTLMTISAIEPTIIIPEGGEATTFGFVFYTDEGGLPGAEVDNVSGTITSSTVTGQNFGRDFIRYAVDLDAPVILEAGTYWMEMTSDAEGWESTTASVMGSTLAFNNASTAGAWVNDGTGMEMVYEIVATCETLGIDDMSSFDFAYYPNPVKDVLNITSNKKIENVSVYNLTGQQVLANAKVNNGQINVSTLSTGVYVFRATLQGGQVETFKIIKK